MGPITRKQAPPFNPRRQSVDGSYGGIARLLIVTAEELRAGMKLAAPVPHPEFGEQVLLQSGFTLDDSVVGRLREIGIAYVFVDYPGFAELDRHVAAQLSPARQRIYACIKRTVEDVQKSVSPTVPYREYVSGTRDLVETLLTQGRNPLFIDQMSRGGADVVGHCTAVAQLSLTMGIRLEQYLIDERKRLPMRRAKDVLSLGVGGMLHDIGKCKLDESLRGFSDVSPPADAAQRAEWETHARLGYEMVHDDIEPSAAAGVLHHHQHFDGSGFPATQFADKRIEKQAGKRIHIFPRIIQVADLYDRLATDGQDGKRRPNIVVQHLLRARFSTWIDPTVMQTLLAVAPPFPPGSRVTLSDQTEAVVMKVDALDPYRPTVRRVTKGGWDVSGEVLDLRYADSPTVALIGQVAVAPYLPPDRATRLAG